MALMNLRPAPIIGGLLFFSVFLISSLHHSSYGVSLRSPHKQLPQEREPHVQLLPLKHKFSHVALASTFGAWHHDVLVPVGHSMEMVLGRNDSIRLYVETPYKLGEFGFDDVLNRTGIYHGQQFQYHTLTNDMSKTDLFPASPGALIDLVVLGTCEFDMEFWSRQLLDVWDARPDDKKFTIACIVHDLSDLRPYKDTEKWAIRGALRYLTIADHVSVRLRKHLHSLAEGADPQRYYSMLEYTKIDVHIPVLPLPDPPRPLKGERKLTHAVIQGLMDPTRRDYIGVLSDLWAALKEDPAAWGYLPPFVNTKEFVPDTTDPANPPFQLHIVGTGWIHEFPDELHHVVKFHRDLDYWQFYDLMQRMDIVLPAFANGDYYDLKASSTVVMAIQCNVPMLVTRRFHKSYAFAADDRVTIVRPHALREIHAIQAFRSGVFPPPPPTAASSDASYSSVYARYREILHGSARERFEGDVKRMLSIGWERTNEEFAAFKEGLWEKNRVLASRLLNDS